MTVPDGYDNWRKSRRSQQEVDCVEVAVTPDVVGVRDTKNRGGGKLDVPASGWVAFVSKLGAQRA